MSKTILPKNWEISQLEVILTDFVDIDNPQTVRVKFVDEAAGFFPIIDTETETCFDPEELKQFAELADKVCKTLDYMAKVNFEETK